MAPSPSSSSARPILLVAGLVLVLGVAAGVLLLLRDGGDGPPRPDVPAVGITAADPAQPTFGANGDPNPRDRKPIEVPRNVPVAATSAATPLVAAPTGPTGSIEGLAVDKRHQPVAGVKVSIYKGNSMFAGPLPGARRLADVTAESGADGHFRIDGVPVDRSYVLVGEHDDYARSEAPGVNVERDQVARDITLIMSDGAVIQGTVTTTAASPIANARVELYYLLDSLLSQDQRPWKVVFTDGAGRFAFTHVSSTSIKVKVEAEGYETQVRQITYAFEPEPKDQVLTFALGEGISLPGRTVTSDGRPVPKARVEMTSLTQGTQGSSIAFSDDSGYFILDGLNAASAYSLVATCPGYSDKRMQRVTASAGTIQVVLDERGAAEGHVRDAGGRPVGEFSLALMKSYPGRDPNSLGDVRDFRSADGSFRFDDIDPGDYVLEARADDLADTRSEPFTIAGGLAPAVPVEITMLSGGTLKGTVRDSGGKPVAGALVELHENGYFESPLTEIFKSMGPSDERLVKTLSGADGGYAFLHVMPGTYQVRATSDTSAPAVVNDVLVVDDSAGGNRPVDLTLPRSATIAGRAVNSNSAPLAFCKVQLTGQDGLTYMEASTTDANGHFAFANLPAGKYMLSVTPQRDENDQPMHPLLTLVAASKSQTPIYVGEGQSFENVLIQLPSMH